MPILLPDHENFTLDEYNKYVGTLHQGKFWKKISGAGTMAVSENGFVFSGVQTWEIDTFVPTNLGVNGIFGNFWHQQVTGAATVSIGVDCYDAAKVLLGNRASFFTGAAPAVDTNVYNYTMLQGGAVTNFFVNTTFAKVKVIISANTGTYALRMPVFNTMPYASKSLYV